MSHIQIRVSAVRVFKQMQVAAKSTRHWARIDLRKSVISTFLQYIDSNRSDSQTIITSSSYAVTVCCQKSWPWHVMFGQNQKITLIRQVRHNSKHVLLVIVILSTVMQCREMFVGIEWKKMVLTLYFFASCTLMLDHTHNFFANFATWQLGDSMAILYKPRIVWCSLKSNNTAHFTIENQKTLAARTYTSALFTNNVCICVLANVSFVLF